MFRKKTKTPIITKSINGRIFETHFIASGFPPLPESVRKAFYNYRLLNKTRFIGILFQPKSWTQVQEIVPSLLVDPALIVEWKSVPGEYYALSIWGEDKPLIEEFVE